MLELGLCGFAFFPNFIATFASRLPLDGPSDYTPNADDKQKQYEE